MNDSEIAVKYQPTGDEGISKDPAESKVSEVVGEQADDVGVRSEKSEKCVSGNRAQTTLLRHLRSAVMQERGVARKQCVAEKDGFFFGKTEDTYFIKY